MGAVGFGSYNLGGDGQDAEQVSGAPITPSVFPVLGLQPVRGRAFRDRRRRPGRAARRDDQRSAVAPAIRARSERRSAGTSRSTRSTSRSSGSRRRAITLLAPGDLLGAAQRVSRSAPAESRRLGDRSTEVRRDDRAGAGGMDAVSRTLGVEAPEIKDWGYRGRDPLSDV